MTSGGAPVTGATVCLFKPGDVYMVGDTDALGTMTFYIEPAELGTLYVTVTGEDYLPYLGSSTVEDSDTGIPAGHGAVPFSLSVEPNPFRSRVSLAVTSAPNAEVEIEIFDIRGRLVEGFEVLASDGGVAAVTWEGVDSGGRKVSPGIYIVRVRTESATLTRKALIIR